MKKKFNGWEWDCIDADIVENTETRLEIKIYGYVGIKKNGRTNMRGLSLPSPNYIEWHKRMMKCLGNIEYKFNTFPCSLHMDVLYGNKRRTDLDNRLSSIMDLLTDLGIIKDDNHDIIPEIHMTSLGYRKNCPIMRIVLEGSNTPILNDEEDYKGKNLKEVLI